jgi:hypothetical protein
VCRYNRLVQPYYTRSCNLSFSTTRREEMRLCDLKSQSDKKVEFEFVLFCLPYSRSLVSPSLFLKYSRLYNKLVSLTDWYSSSPSASMKVDAATNSWS